MDSAEKEYGSSRYARQLAAGFSYPRFAENLEQEYRTNYHAQNVARIRIGLFLTAVIALFGALIDFLTFPADQRLATVFVSLCVMLPALIYAYWAAGKARLLRCLHRYLLLAALAIGLGITLIAYLVPAHNYAPLALMLFILFAYFVSGLLLHYATCAGLVVLVAFASLKVFGGAELGTEFAQCMFVLISGNLMGIAGCYSVECMNRAAFLRAGAAHELAGIDELTGLPNRRRFMRHAEALWSQAQRDGAMVGFMMIDVDNFKRYNDAVGHLAGDKCLRRIGDALLRSPRRALDMVARYGGEEFVGIWFPGKAEAVPELASRVHRRINATHVLHPDSDISDYVTTCIGVACCDTASMSLQDGIRLADKALYEAKRAGRNCVMYVRSDDPERMTRVGPAD